MCGIICVVQIQKSNIEKTKQEVLERARRIRHRGPDWSGTYTGEDVVIAHERLGIIDPLNGAQPLYNEDKSCILAVNGEIYNHKVLRKELMQDPAPRFKTESDCECLLYLYEEGLYKDDHKLDTPRGNLKYKDTIKGASSIDVVGGMGLDQDGGDDRVRQWINRLNGIFAFVLVDEKRKRVIAVRDHIGIIPLYYGRDEHGALWFSSELKGLVDVCVTCADFPPGHFYDSATGKLHQWYKPAFFDPEYVPQMGSKRVQGEQKGSGSESKTVQKTTMDGADRGVPVPVPDFDTKVLRAALEKAIISQMMADVSFGVLLSGGLDSSLVAAVAAKHVRENPAFTSKLHSFSVGLKDSPDLKAARKVAKHIGTEHHEIVFTVEEGLNAISDVIYHLETYDTTTVRASTPMYLMARAMRVFGLKMCLSGEGADEVFCGYLYWHKAPTEKELRNETIRKLKDLYKYDCLRCNKSMAAFSIEARPPFLDREFLELAMGRIPSIAKACGNLVNGRCEKWILRKAFEDLLPKDVAWRQKEAFSDGCGYNWILSIKAHAEKFVSDEELSQAKYRYPINTPATKEQYFYRYIFSKHFPQSSAALAVPGGPSVACSSPAVLLWDKSFQEFADCSQRSIAGVHKRAYDSTQRKQYDCSLDNKQLTELRDAYQDEDEKKVGSKRGRE